MSDGMVRVDGVAAAPMPVGDGLVSHWLQNLGNADALDQDLRGAPARAHDRKVG